MKHPETAEPLRFESREMVFTDARAPDYHDSVQITGWYGAAMGSFPVIDRAEDRKKLDAAIGRLKSAIGIRGGRRRSR